MEDMDFEGYAALWGCDPVYERSPLEYGDGYMFYNFAVEGYDHGFLRKFLPAIDRQIRLVEIEQSKGLREKNRDKEDLELLKEEVQRRLKTPSGKR
jgi:hypothetical protein